MNKQEIKNIIAEAKSLPSYEERLSYLKDKFKGQTCYILGCGPSLKEVDKHSLTEELSDNCLFTIKQSYFSFKEHVDFHFFNTNNYMHYPDRKDVFYIGSSDWDEEAVARALYWKKQQVDMCTRVISGAPLSKRQYSEDFEGLEPHTFENSGLERGWGAGIMYENVLFFAYHLGFSSIKTIGWDYIDVNSGDNTFYHFYNNKSRDRMMNPAKDPYNGEMEDSINLSGVFKTFFDENDISLQCHESEQCYVHASIERYTI